MHIGKRISFNILSDLYFLYCYLNFFCTWSTQIQRFLNRSILPVDGSIISTTTPSQSGPGINGNEGVLHTPEISTSGASSSVVVKCHTQDIPLPAVEAGRDLLCWR